MISIELRDKYKSAEFEDITRTEQEIVYIVSVSSNRVFSSNFLGLIELGANRTAQNISDRLVNLLRLV